MSGCTAVQRNAVPSAEVHLTSQPPHVYQPKGTMAIIGGRNRKPRKFDYEPRFYDPSKDEDIKRRMRVSRKSRRRDPTSLLYLIGLLLFTLYIYHTL